MMTPLELVTCLGGCPGTRDLPWFDRWRLIFRPLICPMSLLLDLIPPGAAVYDVGCGSGGFLALIQAARKPRALGGNDIRPAAIAAARRLLPTQARLSIHNSVRRAPDLHGFDLVFLVDVLHHVQPRHKMAFLKNLFDAMDAGSRLIMKDMERNDGLRSLANKIHDLIFSQQVGSELSMGETAELLRRIGFRIENESRHRVAVYSHFLLQCIKPAFH